MIGLFVDRSLVYVEHLVLHDCNIMGLFVDRSLVYVEHLVLHDCNIMGNI
jgi:hypothetical protein